MTIEYQQHHLSACWPSMPESDLAALAEDIRKYGQREPGIMFEGLVLDGWHRYRACEMIGEEFIATEYRGKDPVGVVTSRNQHRRHLSASQRAAAVVACSEWAPAQRPNKGEPGSPLSTNADLAKAANTTVRTVQQAKVAVTAGLGDAVRDGMMSAKTAAALATGKDPDAKTEAQKNADAAFGDDDDNLLSDLQETIRQLEREVAALSASDQGAEMIKQVQLLQIAERSRDSAMHTAKIDRDAMGKFSRFYGQVEKLTKCESFAACLAWIKARL